MKLKAHVGERSIDKCAVCVRMRVAWQVPTKVGDNMGTDNGAGIFS